MAEDMTRPSNISPYDWDRMPWYAREKAIRALARAQRATTVNMPKVKKAGGGVKRRIRIYRVEPHCWEITDGINTARTANAQAAWRLLEHLSRTA